MLKSIYYSSYFSFKINLLLFIIRKIVYKKRRTRYIVLLGPKKENFYDAPLNKEINLNHYREKLEI